MESSLPNRSLRLIAASIGITIAFAALVASVIWLICPKLITGDYADVTITSLTYGANGQVNLNLSTVSSRGTTVQSAFWRNDKYLGGGNSSGDGFFGRPTQGSDSMAFDLDPEHIPLTGRFEDSRFYARLLVHEGDHDRIYPHHRLYFYDFKAANGDHLYAYIEVLAPHP
jgi:hypothetical protein